MDIRVRKEFVLYFYYKKEYVVFAPAALFYKMLRLIINSLQHPCIFSTATENKTVTINTRD